MYTHLQLSSKTVINSSIPRAFANANVFAKFCFFIVTLCSYNNLIRDSTTSAGKFNGKSVINQ